MSNLVLWTFRGWNVNGSKRSENDNQLHNVNSFVHLPWAVVGNRSYDVWMRTFLLFLPFLLLRKELFAGTLLPLLCKRDSDDVDDEKDDPGVALRRRGNELLRGASFTFNFTLNIFACRTFSRFCLSLGALQVVSVFQCQQVELNCFFDWFTARAYATVISGNPKIITKWFALFFFTLTSMVSSRAECKHRSPDNGILVTHELFLCLPSREILQWLAYKAEGWY